MEKKEKIRVAAPYADRKPPRGMEIAEPDPNCPRCMRVLTWVEDEAGSIKLWCFHCSGGTV